LVRLVGLTFEITAFSRGASIIPLTLLSPCLFHMYSMDQIMKDVRDINHVDANPNSLHGDIPKAPPVLVISLSSPSPPVSLFCQRYVSKSVVNLDLLSTVQKRVRRPVQPMNFGRSALGYYGERLGARQGSGKAPCCLDQIENESL
jgi:hypothetical protein